MPLPQNPTPDATSALPPTCSVKNWVVFAPGYWKGDLYVPQRCEQIAVNFDRLASEEGHTVPYAKIGHDKQQRFSKSLGFTNVGAVTRCQCLPGGYLEIDVSNVPTEVGGEINAGRLCGGSVELKSHERDPQDAAKEVPGDVLTGVSFLGEEQPAVRAFPPELRARAKPHATFPDGSAVPANPSPARWLNAMADVTAQMAAEVGGEYLPERRAVRIKGREYSDTTACFSDFQPDADSTMTPEEIAAKLQAAGVPLSPEQQAALGGAAMAAPPAAAPAAPVVPATSPTMSAEACKPGEKVGFGANFRKMADAAKSPEEKAMYSAFADEMDEKDKQFSEITKRVGELQASADAGRAKTEEAQMAAFSAMVDLDLNGDESAGKLPNGRLVKPGLAYKAPPKHRPALKELLVAQFGPAVKTFSSESDRIKAYREQIATFSDAMPENPALVTTARPGDGKPVSREPLTGTGQALLGALTVTNPRVVERLSAPAK